MSIIYKISNLTLINKNATINKYSIITKKEVKIMASMLEGLKALFTAPKVQITKKELQEAEQQGKEAAERVEERLKIQHVEIDHAVANTNAKPNISKEVEEKEK